MALDIQIRHNSVEKSLYPYQSTIVNYSVLSTLMITFPSQCQHRGKEYDSRTDFPTVPGIRALKASSQCRLLILSAFLNFRPPASITSSSRRLFLTSVPPNAGFQPANIYEKLRVVSRFMKVFAHSVYLSRQLRFAFVLFLQI